MFARRFRRRQAFGLSLYVTDTIALSQKPVSSTDTSNTTPLCVVRGIVMAGVRKVKNFRLELSCPVPAAFALIYLFSGGQ
jgi:hypothetical protein